VLAAIALLFGDACTSTKGPGPAGEIRQADLSDGAVPPAPSREYAVFASVTSDPAPPARGQTSLVFDSAHGVSVLFGGNGANGQLADTWQYDGKWAVACAPPCASAPGAREAAAMAFAEGRGVAVLFGGFRSPSALCETWEWDGAKGAWRAASQPACTDGEGPAARRYFHAMAGLGNDVVMFGGSVITATGAPVSSNAIYRWDGQSWTDLCDADCKSGTLPAPRVAPTLVRAHTAAHDVVLLFGGYAGPNATNDTWQFDPAAGRWTELCTSQACKAGAPLPRGQHGAAFDSIRGRMVVHGGCTDGDCKTAFSDVWEYDVANDAWSEAPRSITTGFPDAKSDFGAAFDAKRGRVVEFGGFLKGSPLATTVEYYTRGTECAGAGQCDTGNCTKANANDATGTCTEKCTGAATGAGACVGGFRCDSACDAPCETCLAVPGHCTPIVGGPDDEAGDAPASHCSGTRTCASEPPASAGKCLLISGQTCGNAADCASGNCSRYGNHVCADPNCGDRPCRPASAAGTCTTFGSGHFVADCLGKACGADGFCLDNCATDDDCDPDYYCDDASHDCKRGKRYGAPCASLDECGKGVCADGVCCNEACNDSCQRCGADGICRAIAKNEVPSGEHTPCAGADAGVCAGYCDGIAKSCTYPDRPCGDGTCFEGDWRLGGACDHGECISNEDPRTCGAFSCRSGACNTECGTNVECRRGAVCDITQGVCNDQGVTCGPDGASVRTPSGAVISCDGYPCNAGACAFKPCNKNSECAPGYACSSDHRCLAVKGGSDASAPGSPDGGAGTTDSGLTPKGPEPKGPAPKGPEPKNGADAGSDTTAAPSDTSCSVPAPGRGRSNDAAFAGMALAALLVRRRVRAPRRRRCRAGA
jgi:hypothetical protein